jgi:hypothetical protein
MSFPEALSQRTRARVWFGGTETGEGLERIGIGADDVIPGADVGIRRLYQERDLTSIIDRMRGEINIDDCLARHDIARYDDLAISPVLMTLSAIGSLPVNNPCPGELGMLGTKVFS